MNSPVSRKLTKARFGAAATALTVVPALALSAYVLSPTLVGASSDSSICVTAERLDDSSVISQRGDCSVETQVPTETVTPSPTATPTVTPTPEPTATPAPAPVNHLASLNWTSKTQAFRTLAVSADGATMIYSDSTYGDIYLSTDSGVTWTKKLATSGMAHHRLAMSSDGTTMFASGYTGAYTADTLWVSTNSGNTWRKAYTGREWNQGATTFTELQVSKDGSTLTAQDTGGSTSYISTDKGLTWASIGRYMKNVVMSGDGKILYGGTTTSALYKRVNGGAWTLMPSPLESGSVAVTGVNMSSDGNSIIVTTGTSFHVSRDGGTTWEQHPEFGSRAWTTPNVSADGSVMTMLSSNQLYASTDSGSSWSIVNYPLTSTTSFALSPNGDRITATQSGKWWFGQ